MSERAAWFYLTRISPIAGLVSQVLLIWSLTQLALVGLWLLP